MCLVAPGGGGRLRRCRDRLACRGLVLRDRAVTRAATLARCGRLCIAGGVSCSSAAQVPRCATLHVALVQSKLPRNSKEGFALVSGSIHDLKA